MNMYRIQYKQGKKIIDEHVLSADSPYEAAARIEAAHPLEEGQALVVFNERGNEVLRQRCRKRSKGYCE